MCNVLVRLTRPERASVEGLRAHFDWHERNRPLAEASATRPQAIPRPLRHSGVMKRLPPVVETGQYMHPLSLEARRESVTSRALGATNRFWPAVHGDVALPMMALGAYLVVVAFRGAAFSNAMFAYADGPEAAYLGAAVLSAPTRLPLHSEIVVSLMEAGFLRAPFGHLLIQLLGPVLEGTAIAILCIAVRRLGGAWWLTAAMGLALGPIGLWATLYPTAHVYTLLCLAVLSLTVITLVRHRLRPRHAVVVGVLSGSALISDQSFAVEGLLPFTLILALFAARGSRELLRPGAGVIVATAVTTAAGAALMAISGVHTIFELTAGVTTYNTVWSSVNTIVHSLSALVSGSWFGSDPAPPLGALTSLLGVGLVLVAPCALLLQRRRRSDDGLTAYLLFWTVADLAVLVGFVVGGYGGPPQQGHYLIPCVVSAVATFPLLVTPRRRVAGGVLAAAFVLVQAFAVLTLSASTLSGGDDTYESARILAAIRAAGLTRGYAEYWLSHPITWLSGETVQVLPVEQLNCDGGMRLCPYLYSSDAWYRPIAGPAFLLVTSTDHCVVSAPASLGAPSSVVTVDDHATLYLYDHDITTSFAHSFVQLC